jgi:hypothetical protein
VSRCPFPARSKFTNSGPGLLAADLDPGPEPGRRLVRQRQQLALVVTLAEHGHGAGVQVQVLEVETDQLAAAEGQVEQQADDGPIPDRPPPPSAAPRTASRRPRTYIN